MHRTFILIVLFAVALGCSSGRSGTDRPGGMTGTSGTTTGTGTAAPTGTIGTGGTADPASPGAVIPKEGESLNDSDDSAINATVVARLKQEGLDQSIKAETDEGIVTLKGTVSSQEQLERIIRMIQSIPEVESVTSEVTVK